MFFIALEVRVLLQKYDWSNDLHNIEIHIKSFLSGPTQSSGYKEYLHMRPCTKKTSIFTEIIEGQSLN